MRHDSRSTPESPARARPMTDTAKSTELVRLILIDDNTVDRAAIKRALAQTSGRYEIEEFDSGETGFARVQSGPADCVLLDYSLPDASGLEVLARLQAADCDVPVIMLTGIGDEELVIESLRRGAYDFLSKAKLEPDILAAKIRVARRLHEADRRARAAEAELRNSVDQLRRAVAARDSVLAVVSHDLRGPLNNIELAMGLLVENISPQQRDLAIASVHRAITRADRLISDLLDVARLSGGAIELNTEAVDPAHVVDTAVSDVQPAVQQQKLTLRVDIAKDVGPIRADRNRVIQVLDNLLRNAIKYGPRGGEVSVEVCRRGNAIEFSVRDQGPGLDIETQAHVFDWFWRAKDRKTASGSGLGLAIALGLVRAHDGEIGVESTPGHGARFYFTIPLVRP
jgi:signal transduction histidine kinase